MKYYTGETNNGVNERGTKRQQSGDVENDDEIQRENEDRTLNGEQQRGSSGYITV